MKSKKITKKHRDFLKTISKELKVDGFLIITRKQTDKVKNKNAYYFTGMGMTDVQVIFALESTKLGYFKHLDGKEN